MSAFKWQTNAARDTVQFVRRDTKHKEMDTRDSKESKFEKKVRETGWVVLIVIIVFLSSTVVEVKWNACFWNTFHLLWLTVATFMKWFEVFKNNVITFAWQLFAYFYQIPNLNLFKYRIKYLFKPTLNEQNNLAY